MPLKLILMFWVTSTHSHGQDPNLKMVDTGNMLLSPIWTRTKLKLEKDDNAAALLLAAIVPV